MHSAHALPIEDEQDGVRYEQSAMTSSFNSNAQAAVQYLTWALEEIEKAGNKKAAQHARSALDAMREANPPANLRA